MYAKLDYSLGDVYFYFFIFLLLLAHRLCEHLKQGNGVCEEIQREAW